LSTGPPSQAFIYNSKVVSFSGGSSSGALIRWCDRARATTFAVLHVAIRKSVRFQGWFNSIVDFYFATMELWKYHLSISRRIMSRALIKLFIYDQCQHFARDQSCWCATRTLQSTTRSNHFGHVCSYHRKPSSDDLGSPCLLETLP
jgi:hypothetical protein